LQDGHGLHQYITQVHLDFGAVQLLPQECERYA
jgi:hypothetical protein